MWPGKLEEPHGNAEEGEMVAGAEEGELVLGAALQGGGQQRQVPDKQRNQDFLGSWQTKKPRFFGFLTNRETKIFWVPDKQRNQDFLGSWQTEKPWFLGSWQTEKLWFLMLYYLIQPPASLIWQFFGSFIHRSLPLHSDRVQGRWVAKKGDGRLSLERWVAKLIARLLATAALWVNQTSLKNTT